MPLHGKIVVLKRSGGDGTEFPLTASCMFGRKPDCDIRIQLPQVSKEHCRIDLNENKEVILTNLSSVTPTQVNGQALQQSERLKHGDVITIVDRSFRFEYPPPPTPKKRSSVGGKAETAAAVDPHLKDGTNIDNIQRSLEKTQELESKEERKTASPFSDLYQMIKQSLDVKTPRKSSVSVLQTPSSKYCTPKPQSARKSHPRPVVEAKDSVIQVDEEQAGDAPLPATPKSAKNRRSVQLPIEQEATPAVITSRRTATPQRYTVSEAIEQISQTQRSPSRRKSKETTSPVCAEKQVGSPAKMENTSKATQKSLGKGNEKSKKRKSEELAADLPTQLMKRKRVSFGTNLSPELFDKRLPPDSPLRKGATPRRSLSLYKPKQSLLRRASVIGLLKECENPKVKSPAKMKTPSPKKSSSAKSASSKMPSSAKKSPASPRAQSPKSKSPSPGKKSTTPTNASPKAKSPAHKVLTPKSKSPSREKSKTPKKASPKSPKAQSPKIQSPKSPSPSKVATPKKASPKMPAPKSLQTTPAKSPIRNKPETPKNKLQQKSSSTEGTPKRKSSGPVVTPVETPLPSADQTPKVQGRFSVSRINTPSPIAEDVMVESVPSAMVTPKIPLRKKSLKSSSKKTPALKSAAKVMRRKSGMRASMKVMTSWADIVRFGKAKVQVAAPIKSQVTKKTMKKSVPKPQTPKRRFVDHVSTGHAASPATIVVGRAHRLRFVHSTGAPPKIVTNTVVLRKNLKMDEDLTGISDMFKTPKNEKKRSAKIISETRTPLGDINKSQIEPSVLNTPEETGEMVVSPMSVASTIKGRRYNSEAVQRLLCDEVPPMNMQSEVTEQSTELKVKTPRTPKQKPQMSECLTGVKRMMKTPKPKAESVEDLRGKLLKTPKQMSEQQECLSAIKRIMKTPKEKALPVEDLWEKLLKTPKQKAETLECLSAVKTIMKTPEQKVEQPECISGAKKLTRTPKQKIEQQECLTGVKRIMKTPKEKSQPIEDIRGKLLLTPKQKIEQQVFLTGVKRIMKTPKPKAQPVEKNFGLKRLMRSPRLRGNSPVEDFEGLEELMKEPVEEQTFENTEVTIEQPECTSEPPVVAQMEVDKVIATEVVVDQAESTPITSAEITEMSTSVKSVQEGAPETKSVLGRRAKAPEPEVENKPSSCEETVEAPVKTRRGRKVESLAPRQTTRGRNAKIPEGKAPEEPEGKVQESTFKPRIATLSKEPPQEQIEGDPIPTEQEHNLHTAVQEVEQSAASEEPVVKPRRGRKTKAAEPCDVTMKAQSAEPQESNEKMPSEKLQDDSTERPTKSTRGRKAEVMETEAEKEVVPTEAEGAKDEEVSAAVVCRGRRGKKTEAPALPTVKQRRGRAVKGQENTEANNVLLEDTQQVAETVLKEKNDQTCVFEPTEEMVQEKPKRGRKTKAPVEPAPEIIAVVSELPMVEAKPEQPVPNEKPKRGRRAKTQAEPPQPEAESAVEDASPPAVDEAVEDAKVEQPVPTEKPKRGRRPKSAAERIQMETKISTVEREPVDETQPEQSVPAEKPKRGRKARPAENSNTNEVSQTSVQGKASRTVELEEEDKVIPEQQPSQFKSREPKRMRRTKKVEEPSAAVQTTEAVKEAPVFEQVKSESPTPKSRRGAHKPKEAESNTLETTEEVSVISATDKPKRGRKVKEDIKAAEVNITEQAPEDDSAPAKPTRGRGSTAVSAVPAVPAKRARRGAAVPPEESTAQVTEEFSEAVKRGRRAVKTPACVEPKGSTAVSAVPAKRARRGAAVLPEESTAQVTEEFSEAVKRGRRAVKTPACVESKNQDNSTVEPSNDVEDTITSKRSVKWKSDFEVIKVTPLKTVQGRKTKSAQQNRAENVPHNVTIPEEKDLSEKAQPVKRARRGAKAVDVEESTKTTVENTEAETQPKTRRGRVAKK